MLDPANPRRLADFAEANGIDLTEYDNFCESLRPPFIDPQQDMADEVMSRIDNGMAFELAFAQARQVALGKLEPAPEG